MSTYIGSHISLLSTSDVRYEGTLSSIDEKESTIALQNVKHWGTEDRRTDKVVEASPIVYKLVVFRGENIKNLKLMEEENDDVLINDPAILQVQQGPDGFHLTPGKSPKQQQMNNRGNNVRRGNWNGSRGGNRYLAGNSQDNYFRGANRSRGAWFGGRNARGRGGGWEQGYYNNSYGYPQNEWMHEPRSGRAGGSRDTHNRNIRRRGGSRGRSSRQEDRNSQSYIPGTGKFLERQTKDTDDSDLMIPDKEFDFQGNLARFDMTSMKDALTEESLKKTETEKDPKEPKSVKNAGEIESKEENLDQDLWDEQSKDSTTEDVACAYDRTKNFFDSLSTNQDVANRQTGSDMRELNAETFGKIGSTYRCRTRWFRRWRGRGNRTTFRGGFHQRNL